MRQPLVFSSKLATDPITILLMAIIYLNYFLEFITNPAVLFPPACCSSVCSACYVQSCQSGSCLRSNCADHELAQTNGSQQKSVKLIHLHSAQPHAQYFRMACLTLRSAYHGFSPLQSQECFSCMLSGGIRLKSFHKPS